MGCHRRQSGSRRRLRCLDWRRCGTDGVARKRSLDHRREPRAGRGARGGAGGGRGAGRAGGARRRRAGGGRGPHPRKGRRGACITGRRGRQTGGPRDRRRGRGAGRSHRPSRAQRQHAGSDAAAAAARHRVRGPGAGAANEPGRTVPADQADRGRDGAARLRPGGARQLRRGGRGVPALGCLRRLEGGAGPPEPALGGRAAVRGRAFLLRRPRRDGYRDARGGDAGSGSRGARAARGSGPLDRPDESGARLVAAATR